LPVWMDMLLSFLINTYANPFGRSSSLKARFHVKEVTDPAKL
jgi:hypothetical protein